MPILRRERFMTENLNNQVSCEECQEPRGEYQPGGIIHQMFEDPVQCNFLSGNPADWRLRFVAHLLCKCGSLAGVWSEGSKAFVWCRGMRRAENHHFGRDRGFG
jgi:hypothetical protein